MKYGSALPFAFGAGASAVWFSGLAKKKMPRLWENKRSKVGWSERVTATSYRGRDGTLEDLARSERRNPWCGLRATLHSAC
jgi:hypothetical protein